MFTYNEVYEAYLDCYKNKKNSPGAILFRENLYNNIKILTDEINNHCYSPPTIYSFCDNGPKIERNFCGKL